MKSHGCALGSVFGTAPQLVGRAWWLCRHSLCSIDFATTCLGVLYEVKKKGLMWVPRPSVCDMSAAKLFVGFQGGRHRSSVQSSGRLTKWAQGQAYCIEWRKWIWTCTSRIYIYIYIYILPIWVKLPRPAEDLNVLPLYIYEFHEIWSSKLIHKRVYVIFPRALHFLLIWIKVGTRQAYKNVLTDNRCSKICRLGT